MQKVRLEQLSSALLPEQDAVDKLASKGEKFVAQCNDAPVNGRGEALRFQFVELRDFLPGWSEAAPYDSDSDDDGSATNQASKNLCKALGVASKKKSPRLTLVQWVTAFDRFSLAAAGLGMYACAHLGPIGVCYV